MTAIDPERRGSGVNPEMAGLMAPMSDRDSGTPSHDHHSDPLLNAWGRRTGGAEATAQGRFNQFSFPTSRTSSNAPSGRFSMILQSKLFRNIAVLTTSLLLILSVLHTTKPEVLGSGLKYMSNLPGLSRLAQQEIRSLDERLRDLMTRPVLEQWELELTNRYQVGRIEDPATAAARVDRHVTLCFSAVPDVHILQVSSHLDLLMHILLLKPTSWNLTG